MIGSDRVALIRAIRAQACACGPRAGRCVHAALASPAIPLHLHRHRRHTDPHFGCGLPPTFDLTMQLGYVELILQADANGTTAALLNVLSDGRWHPYIYDLPRRHQDLATGALWGLEAQGTRLEHKDLTTRYGAITHGVRLIQDSQLELF